VATLLLVEDDPAIRSALMRSLRDLGHAVNAVDSGMAALSGAVEQKPDVVLLDLGLPDIDGADVLSMLRAVSEVPVIIATARDDEAEIVRLLDLGADDYLIKPFTAAQLNARIKAVMRRSGRSDEDPVITIGALSIDTRSRQVTVDGRDIDLARKEFDLLLALARRPGEVVTKRDLLAEVWQLAWGGSDRTVDVHLSWLRRKLGESASDPKYVHSVRGVGVRLAAPVSGVSAASAAASTAASALADPTLAD
jgi:DNA-binding response OmpR family regulator